MNAVSEGSLEDASPHKTPEGEAVTRLSYRLLGRVCSPVISGGLIGITMCNHSCSIIIRAMPVGRINNTNNTRLRPRARYSLDKPLSLSLPFSNGGSRVTWRDKATTSCKPCIRAATTGQYYDHIATRWNRNYPCHRPWGIKRRGTHWMLLGAYSNQI